VWVFLIFPALHIIFLWKAFLYELCTTPYIIPGVLAYLYRTYEDIVLACGFQEEEVVDYSGWILLAFVWFCCAIIKGAVTGQFSGLYNAIAYSYAMLEARTVG
jgi:hypothetical protein